MANKEKKRAKELILTGDFICPSFAGQCLARCHLNHGVSLYKWYKLTKDEIAFIESMIKPMGVSD